MWFASWANPQAIRGNFCHQWANLCIEVIGKGNRLRFVPLHETVREELKVHLHDRKKLQKFKTIPDKSSPFSECSMTSGSRCTTGDWTTRLRYEVQVV